MKLKRSGEMGHPCLVPDLSRKVSCFSPPSVMLMVGFYNFFMKWRKFPSISSFLTIFIMNGGWTLSNAFSDLLI